jgi:hypothetical protein
MLATGIAIQIAVTLPLVWWLCRRSSEEHVSTATTAAERRRRFRNAEAAVGTG